MTEKFTAEDGTPVEVVEPGSAEDPFTAKPGGTSAEPSPPPAGTDATPQEPAGGSTGEGGGTQPAPGTGEPAPKPEEPAGAPPATPEEEEVAAPVEEPKPFATPEEEAEAVRKLNEYVEEQTKEAVDASRREIQSSTDKRLAEAEKAAREREQTLREELRELQTRGLSDEEKAALRKTWEQDDRKAGLDAYAKELDGQSTAVTVAILLKDYAEYGVEENDLEDLDSPEEMQVFCAEAKAAYFEEMAKRGKPPEGSEESETKPATKPPEKPAPAGAKAPSDVGGGGATPPPDKPREGTGPEVFGENLGKIPWESAPAKK